MKNKTIQFGLVACLISATMLLAVAGDLPKVSDANRETVRIMKNIKIPPPYTPIYQPPIWQQYLLPARVTPDYSPKVIPAQIPSVPKSTVGEPSALPVTATNAAGAMGTNGSAVDKAVKTPAPVVTPEK